MPHIYFFYYNSILVTAEDIVSRLKVSSSCSTILACVAGAGFFRAKEEISGTREGKKGEGPLPSRVSLARPVKKSLTRYTILVVATNEVEMC